MLWEMGLILCFSCGYPNLPPLWIDKFITSSIWDSHLYHLWNFHIFWNLVSGFSVLFLSQYHSWSLCVWERIIVTLALFWVVISGMIMISTSAHIHPKTFAVFNKYMRSLKTVFLPRLRMSLYIFSLKSYWSFRIDFWELTSYVIPSLAMNVHFLN